VLLPAAEIHWRLQVGFITGYNLLVSPLFHCLFFSVQATCLCSGLNSVITNSSPTNIRQSKHLKELCL